MLHLMHLGYLVVMVGDRVASDENAAAEGLMRDVLACGQELSRALATSLKLHRTAGRFDISISAEITSAEVESIATVGFDAAAPRGEFAVADEIDAAGSIAQDGVIYLLDAFDRKMPRTKPPRH